jgi:hypothetical protein
MVYSTGRAAAYARRRGGSVCTPFGKNASFFDLLKFNPNSAKTWREERTTESGFALFGKFRYQTPVKCPVVVSYRCIPFFTKDNETERKLTYCKI